MDTKASPADPAPVRVTEPDYPSMDVPEQKLAVPDVPGFYLYWHLGKSVRKALRAGYQHVKDEELEVEQKGVANAAAETGNTDMGTNISIVAGGTVDDDDPEPARLYLMKLPLWIHERNNQKKASINESIAQAIRSGSVGSESDPDRNKRYMKKGQDLFYPKVGPRPPQP